MTQTQLQKENDRLRGMIVRMARQRDKAEGKYDDLLSVYQRLMVHSAQKDMDIRNMQLLLDYAQKKTAY